MTNSCQCDHPPGGTVNCPTDHVAFCSVKNGVAQTGCYKPPATVTSQKALDNWALEIVTGAPRLLDQPLSSADQNILGSEKYVRPDGTRVNFRIPPFNTVEGGGSLQA